MKKYVFLVFVLGMSVFLTGCFDDEEGYSLGDYWLGFGLLEETNSDPAEYRIIMDNDDVLIPVASDYHNYWYSHHSDSSSLLHGGDRILVNYTILDDEIDNEGNVEAYYVKVNSVKKILLKGILEITEENEDSIGNDPIVVKEVWMTDSLLNFEIKYWGSHKIHFINLVKQPGALAADGEPVELELRHNANDDDDYIPYVSYVSFNLSELKAAGQDSISFNVTSTDYDGEEHLYEGVYEY